MMPDTERPNTAQESFRAGGGLADWAQGHGYTPTRVAPEARQAAASTDLAPATQPAQPAVRREKPQEPTVDDLTYLSPEQLYKQADEIENATGWARERKGISGIVTRWAWRTFRDDGRTACALRDRAKEHLKQQMEEDSKTIDLQKKEEDLRRTQASRQFERRKAADDASESGLSAALEAARNLRPDNVKFTSNVAGIKEEETEFLEAALPLVVQAAVNSRYAHTLDQRAESGKLPPQEMQTIMYAILPAAAALAPFIATQEAIKDALAVPGQVEEIIDHLRDLERGPASLPKSGAEMKEEKARYDEAFQVYDKVETLDEILSRQTRSPFAGVLETAEELAKQDDVLGPVLLQELRERTTGGDPPIEDILKLLGSALHMVPEPQEGQTPGPAREAILRMQADLQADERADDPRKALAADIRSFVQRNTLPTHEELDRLADYLEEPQGRQKPSEESLLEAQTEVLAALPPLTLLALRVDDQGQKTLEAELIAAGIGIQQVDQEKEKIITERRQALFRLADRLRQAGPQTEQPRPNTKEAALRTIKAQISKINAEGRLALLVNFLRNPEASPPIKEQAQAVLRELVRQGRTSKGVPLLVEITGSAEYPSGLEARRQIRGMITSTNMAQEAVSIGGRKTDIAVGDVLTRKSNLWADAIAGLPPGTIATLAQELRAGASAQTPTGFRVPFEKEADVIGALRLGLMAELGLMGEDESGFEDVGSVKADLFAIRGEHVPMTAPATFTALAILDAASAQRSDNEGLFTLWGAVSGLDALNKYMEDHAMQAANTLMAAARDPNERLFALALLFTAVGIHAQAGSDAQKYWALAAAEHAGDYLAKVSWPEINGIPKEEGGDDAKLAGQVLAMFKKTAGQLNADTASEVTEFLAGKISGRSKGFRPGKVFNPKLIELWKPLFRAASRNPAALSKYSLAMAKMQRKGTEDIIQITANPGSDDEQDYNRRLYGLGEWLMSDTGVYPNASRPIWGSTVFVTDTRVNSTASSIPYSVTPRERYESLVVRRLFGDGEDMDPLTQGFPLLDQAEIVGLSPYPVITAQHAIVMTILYASRRIYGQQPVSDDVLENIERIFLSAQDRQNPFKDFEGEGSVALNEAIFQTAHTQAQEIALRTSAARVRSEGLLKRLCLVPCAGISAVPIYETGKSPLITIRFPQNRVEGTAKGSARERLRTASQTNDATAHITPRSYPQLLGMTGAELIDFLAKHERPSDSELVAISETLKLVSL